MAEVFLFVGASSEEFHRPTGLRYLGLREEAAFGEASSLPSSVMAFSTLSPRVSSRNQTAGRIMPGGRTRNIQLSTPLIFDGRYQMSPDISADDIVLAGQAQKSLMGLMMARKVDVSTLSGHTCQSLGDLKTWNAILGGANIYDTRTFKGLKCSSFTMSTSGTGLSPMPWSITGQFSYFGSESSDYEGSLPTSWISPRLQMPTYNLCASTIRVTESTIDTNTRMTGSIISSPSQVRIQCRRRMQRAAPYGHVTSTGVVQGRNQFPLSERWTVRFAAPAWRDGPMRDLVENAHTGLAAQNRYNLRVDIGGTSGCLYQAMSDADTSALHVPVWENAFNASATGRESARMYAVYASDASVGGVSQYLPKAGDMIRFQTEQGGFVATLGGARMVEGPVSTGFRGIDPIDPAVFDASVTSPWLPCPRPQGHISMWFTDLPEVPGDNRVELVPMGMYFEFKNFVLTSSDGLDNRESKYTIQFSSDSDSQVVAHY